MKKLLYITTLGFLLCGCSEFLEQKSQDEIIPNKIEDLNELIFGELITRTSGVTKVWDAMSDDVTSVWVDNGTDDNTQREGLYQFFTWAKDIEYNYKNEFKGELFYETLYADVVLCNSIEYLIPEMQGAESLKERTLAEVCFFKAWAYFDLLNMYAVPYTNLENSKTTPGVPINNNKGLGMAIFARSTQREVYDLIEQNIERAVELFERGQKTSTIYRPGFEAACILATRIFLAEKKYDKVIFYANKISPEAKLYNLKEFVENNKPVDNITDIPDANYVYFLNKKNTEIVFTYEDEYSPSVFSPQGSSICGKYFPSSNLLEGYEQGDQRRLVFFDRNGNIIKFSQISGNVYVNNLRLSEALLNRAEAYCYVDQAKAVLDVNTLRNARFLDTPPSIGSDVLDAVKAERRREFAFEGLRWLDLRRWGMPKITHEYYLEDNARKAVYTLEEGDPAYTFNLPAAVLDLNSTILRHIRPARTPQIVNI